MVDKIENILVEFDYNNITIVDPNKVVDLDGNVKERFVKQENLVMYANLECRMLPRTKLAVGSANDDSIQTVSVASINFLNPGGKQFLDNSYTNEITGSNTLKGQGVNQINQTKVTNPKNSEDWYLRQTLNSNGKLGATDNGLLGITSINITTNSSFIPSVTMQLEDVQGKTLFQLGNNSPYSAFFNLPYPLFYLTIKGYLGKAVKYQLALKTFNARFDTASGNFKIETVFMAYKYNVLTNLSMEYVKAVPYMYKSKYTLGPTGNAGLQSAQNQVGSTTQDVTPKDVYRGFEKIKEVYSEYKAKGLVSEEVT
jgi:hypothetical protein